MVRKESIHDMKKSYLFFCKERERERGESEREREREREANTKSISNLFMQKVFLIGNV
jgi:hypothetical protein